MKFKKLTFLLIISIFLCFTDFVIGRSIPSPEEILGFKIGQDYKLANWSQILAYFDKLASSSDKVRVMDLGKSTLGRRFIMVIITSSSNMARLDEIKNIQRKLHDPRTLSSEEKEELIKKGKAIVHISCSLHSTEIASSLMSIELAYKLATEESPKTQEILEETVLLLIPSLNPDGIDLVTDWYYKNLGTPFESSPMPWLYHYYSGHDNNRDWFMFNLKETRLATKMLYHEWFPLFVWDLHQMSAYAARFYIPPAGDPVNPNLDPLLIRELNLITTIAALNLTKERKTGVATNAMDNWQCTTYRAAACRHNMIGIVSEAASTNLGSPIFLRKNQIKQIMSDLPYPELQAAYLEPWPGGWWRLRDIIDYEEITAFSYLETIAKNKERYLSNCALFAQRQIEKGKSEPPFAYIVPRDQRDLPTAYKLLEVLHWGGAEIYEAQKSFTANEVKYPAGTFIIPLAQPYRAFIKDVLERKGYPSRSDPQETPDLPRSAVPFDEASWSLPLQMGVKVIEVTNSFSADMRLLAKIEFPPVKIFRKGIKYFLFTNQSNNESILLNRLLEKGISINFSKKSFVLDGQPFTPGTIILSATESKELSYLAKDLGIEIFSTDKEPDVKLSSIRKPKIGIYQSWSANMSEGWLRWALEQFEFPFKILHNDEIKAGDLSNSFTHIILPSMSPSVLVEGNKKGEVPPAYAGGIEEEGISALDSFVRNGGNLIAIENSTNFAIKYFGLPIKNLGGEIYEAGSTMIGSKTQKEEILCSGSLLKVQINDFHPVGFGMGKEGVIFNHFDPIFVVEKGENIVSYASSPLLSGIVVNLDELEGKAGAVECPLGNGKILLLGFNPIHRGQAHGSFKYIFNFCFY